MTDKLLNQLINQYGINLYDSWLNQCIDYLSMLGPFDSNSSSALDRIFEIFKGADMHECVKSSLIPDDIIFSKNGIINGPIILQIDELSDISLPYSKRHNSKISNSNSRKRTYKLFLSDGIHNLVGLELEQISTLNSSLAPGSKLLLKNVRVKHGVLLLERSSTTVLGGGCDRLEKLASLHINTNSEEAVPEQHDRIAAPPPVVVPPAIQQQQYQQHQQQQQQHGRRRRRNR